MLTIDTYRAKIEKIRMEGVQRGLNVGFASFDEYFQYKQGYPLQIYGYPFSGKSEFMFEILLNLSVLHGKKHYLLTPETGEPDEIYSLLIEKYIGKRIRTKNNAYAMTNSEFEQAYYFIGQHFSIHDVGEFPSEEITLQDVYAMANDLCANYWNFDTITIDPWAEITLDLRKFNGREDLAISKSLREMRDDGAKNKRTTIIVNHAQQTKTQFDKASGQYWNPPATPQNMAGGQMWFKRGYTMINVYRPLAEIHEEVHDNEAWIIVQKIKPRGTGKQGLSRFFLDWKTQRYYQLHEGNPIFAEKSGMTYNPKPIPIKEPEQDYTFDNFNEQEIIPF